MIFGNALSVLRWLFFLANLLEFVRAAAVQPGSLQPKLHLPDPAGPLADPCQKNLSLTPKLWQQLEVDQYMANYPGLQKMTVLDFAIQVNASNFYCGVGLHCLAGQICYPVRGINWIILYAVQQWNNWINTAYAAVENSISLMRDASAAIVADFMPLTREDHSLFGWGVATIVIGVLATFSAIVVPALMAGKGVIATLEAYGSTANVAQLAREAYFQAQAAKAAGQMGQVFKLEQAVDSRTLLQGVKSFAEQPKAVSTKLPHWSPTPDVVEPFQKGLTIPKTGGTSRLRKRKLRPPPSAFAYTRWATLDSHLTELQNRLQGVIAGASKLGITAPMYTDNGLAAALAGGSFLEPIPSMSSLQEKAKALAQITAVSQFFISLNMFITVGCDKCEGKNGAWAQDKFLSYCTPQGVMINIIRAEGIDARNEIRNAGLLFSKYGYTTEFLVTNAQACQNKYGFYTEQKAPAPEEPKAECVFQLPVCQCDKPEVKKLRDGKKGTVTACRKGGGLPI